MSEIFQYDHKSPEELAAIIRPQMIGTEEHALDALTALQAQAEFPRYDALRAALRDAQREGDEWKAENERLRAERRNALTSADNWKLQAEDEAAENERLRAALERLAGKDPDGFDGHHLVGDEQNPDECPGCIARAALARGGDAA